MAKAHMIRFTPRKRKSTWSKVNTKRYGELLKMGLVQAAGKKVYDATSPNRPRDSSYEQEVRVLSPNFVRLLKRNKKAWEYFSNEAPWYQRTVSFWVMSAKKDETQLRRLKRLIADCEQGLRLWGWWRPQRQTR